MWLAVALGSLIVLAAPAFGIRTAANAGAQKVGVLLPASLSPRTTSIVGELTRGLRDLGWVEGQNLAIEYRWAGGQPDRLPALAADLVARKVDVIVTGGELATRAARQATSIIPVVMAIVAPVAAEAQQAKIARVGVLLFGTPDTDAFPAIRRGLGALGYVEGRNVLFEYRYAEGRPERLPDLASDLVRSKPDLIIAAGGDVAPFAKRATGTIPIVMITSADPVQGGLVASLARPGGNVTGATFVSSDLAGKRLQFLKEAAPGVTRVAVLWNPDHPDYEFQATEAAGRSLGVRVQSLEVRGRDDFAGAFAAAIRERTEAVIVASSRLMTLNRARILDLAAQNRLQLVSGWGPWATGGGLLSYGPDLDAVIRSSATYVDRILKGARPADLPVEQPTKFELVVNLKTAKALGLTIPPSVLARADEVIE